MKRTVFRNRTFYILLICLIGVLLLYNFHTFLVGHSLTSLLPIVLEIVLIILISTSNQYAKLGIYVWAVISLIIGFGLDAVADLLDGVSSNNINSLIVNIIGLFVGILVISYTKQTVIVQSK